MPLNWNEIRQRVHSFYHEWKDATSERAESQSFWNDFFEILGVSRKKVAVYEKQVIKLNKKYGFIDLLWPEQV